MRTFAASGADGAEVDQLGLEKVERWILAERNDHDAAIVEGTKEQLRARARRGLQHHDKAAASDVALGSFPYHGSAEPRRQPVQAAALAFMIARNNLNEFNDVD